MDLERIFCFCVHHNHRQATQKPLPDPLWWNCLFYAVIGITVQLEEDGFPAFLGYGLNMLAGL